MTPMGETGNERERHSSTASSNSPYASGSSERARGNGSSTSLVPSGLSSGPPSDMMSQGPDGHKIDDEREDNEPADSGIEKSSLSKRKRSIGQRPDSGSRTKRRKTSGTNSEAATRLEENDARPADENGDSEPESNDLSATEKEDEANSVGTKNEDTLAKEDIVTRWKMPIGVYHPVPLERTLVEALKESLRVPPRFLYRASSTEGRKHTNGSDKLSLHRPAADVNKSEMCHATIYEIPNGLGELLEMLGHRFLWLDRRRDETLSWTSSLLFAIVHATGRLAKKQRGVKIHVIDTTKVTTTKGQPVEFHFAPDLLRILDIQSFRGWDRFQITNLRQPWYTHEWISHHVVQSPKEHSYEAKIEDLLDAGLYAFLGSLKTPERRDMRSLYHRCCYSRSLEHVISGALKPITVEEIEASKRLALCFKSPNNHTPEPSINFLIDFLGLTARPKENPALIEWIKKRYIAEDLLNAAISGQQPSTSEQARAQDVLDDHDTAGEEAAKDDGEGSLTLSASEDDGSADDVDLEDEISSSADEMAMVHID
ncbi:hypothetical protein KC338_g4339 [Hortaea werneckii]|nr:hypothetical protein KC323_g5190 [Hortaea werneckii]KAI6867618.1 hypothetical protein KC338_g4339 [Hortaea werneckii]